MLVTYVEKGGAVAVVVVVADIVVALVVVAVFFVVVTIRFRFIMFYFTVNTRFTL